MASKFMTPRDPFGVGRTLRGEIDRLIEDTLIRPADWLANWNPGKTILPLDVYTEGDNLIVKAAMPGLKPEEAKLEVRGDVLTIVGESKLEQESKEHNFHLQDQFCVRLERSVVLPALVDADKAEAVLARGILTVTLPRTHEMQTRQIAIEPAEKDRTVEAPKVEHHRAKRQQHEAVKVEAETVEAQPLKAQTVATQPVEAQPLKAQTVATQPVEAQTDHSQKVERHRAKRQQHEAVKVEAETVEAQPVEAQTVAAQTDETQKVESLRTNHQKHEAAKAEVQTVV